LNGSDRVDDKRSRSVSHNSRIFAFITYATLSAITYATDSMVSNRLARRRGFKISTAAYDSLLCRLLECKTGFFYKLINPSKICTVWNQAHSVNWLMNGRAVFKLLAATIACLPFRPHIIGRCHQSSLKSPLTGVCITDCLCL